MADGDDEYLGFAAERGEVFRLRVADGDGGVALEQHHRDGLADDEAAADDDGALPRQLHAVVVEHVDAGLRGAGSEADLLAGVEPRHRVFRDAVDVLFRRERAADGAVVDVRRQRAQY